MNFGFINVILLYIDHRHVSTTHVTIFSVASANIYIYMVPGVRGVFRPRQIGSCLGR